jgi:hypothetical protein
VDTLTGIDSDLAETAERLRVARAALNRRDDQRHRATVALLLNRVDELLDQRLNGS